MTTWVDYWDELPPSRLLADAESELVAQRYLALERDTPLGTVFDFGCGTGRVGSIVASSVPTVYAWDAAESMRSLASGNASLTVVDDWETEIPAGSLDEVLINSVVQYLDAARLGRLLQALRRKLAHHGSIVVADLIPPDHLLREDLFDLVKFGFRRGFLVQALRGAVLEAIRRKRSYQQLQLYTVSLEDLERIAGAADLQVHPIATNLSHFAGRSTVRLVSARSDGGGFDAPQP